ncbi:MAG: hypothetical protein H0U10_15905, partial [Chloroflexia bacterium]|nr:hypothetical protein [Chloroflexia bacterium]
GAAYWPRLEAPFRRLLTELPGDRAPDPDGDVGDWLYGGEQLPQWEAAVREAARTAFRSAVRRAGTSPRALMGAAQAEDRFNAGLARLLRQFQTAAASGEGGADGAD